MYVRRRVLDAWLRKSCPAQYLSPTVERKDLTLALFAVKKSLTEKLVLTRVKSPMQPTGSQPLASPTAVWYIGASTVTVVMSPASTVAENTRETINKKFEVDIQPIKST